MNLKTAQLINSLQFGFVTSDDLPDLINADRLLPLLVRCDLCRFTAAAQDVPHLLRCIKAGGDCCRGVQVTAAAFDEARALRSVSVLIPDRAMFTEERPAAQPPGAWSLNRPKPTIQTSAREGSGYYDGSGFNESDCGGAFDGFQVSSDADPGL